MGNLTVESTSLRTATRTAPTPRVGVDHARLATTVTVEGASNPAPPIASNYPHPQFGAGPFGLLTQPRKARFGAVASDVDIDEYLKPTPEDALSDEESFEVKAIDHYLVSPSTNPRLYRDQKRLEHLARRDGLDFFPTQFWSMERDTLIQTTARSGFPVRYRHWSFGQEYEDLLLPQKYGLSNLYELVINNDPCYAYLLRENPRYAQRAVIAHVYGHNDFFKNNVNFKETDRQMLNTMGANAALIDKITNDNNLPVEKMERFLELAHSIQWCIDMDERKPRELKVRSEVPKPEPLSKDYGLADTSALPPHMDRIFNPPDQVEQAREAERKRRENVLAKIPAHPDNDLMAFLFEHSTALKPWQKDTLAVVREESYYFVPQIKTKIMNEGWATYWHRRLMRKPEMHDPNNATNLAKMFSGVEAPQQFGINPYQIGRAVYDNIKMRWDKGQHGAAWEEMRDMEARSNYDDKSMKGTEKIFEVRKYESDYSFLNKYLTPEVARDLKLYRWHTKFNSRWDENADIILTNRDFEEIKKSLLSGLENGGQPKIKVMDGNFKNRGELLLEHQHAFDLKPDWAAETLKNVAQMWGRPVHLDTKITLHQKAPDPQWEFVQGHWEVKHLPPPPPEYKPIRLTVEIEKGSTDQTDKLILKRFTLKPNGEVDDEVDEKLERNFGNNRKTWEVEKI